MPGTSKSYSVLGRNFYRTPTGENLYMGRTNKTKNSNSNSNQMSNFSGGSGGGSSPAQIPSLLGNGGNIDFNVGPKSLQSSAKTGRISGGTRAERREARGLREKGSGPNAMAAVGAGIAAGSAALDALDKDPGYGGMDVGKEALKYAAMGAAAGPWGAAAGAVVGAGIGLVKKNRYAKEEKKKKKEKRNAIANAQDSSNVANESESFFARQSAASQGAYGVGDIDNFTNKYS